MALWRLCITQEYYYSHDGLHHGAISDDIREALLVLLITMVCTACGLCGATFVRKCIKSHLLQNIALTLKTMLTLEGNT